MDRVAAPRTRPLSALALAVTAALATTVGAAGPVQAAPDYPTWDEVEAARDDQRLAAEKVAEISGLLSRLQAAAASAGRTALQAGERYHIALDALDQATLRAQNLESQARSAAGRAKESARQAGAIVAQLARTGGGDVAVGLLFDQTKDGDLLARLGTLSKLTEQSAAIYDRAIADRNLARSLTEEAQTAERERAELFEDSKRTLADAESAAVAAEELVLDQREVSAELYSQLAALKGTSAQIEREFFEGASSPEPQVPGGSTPGLPRPTVPGPSDPSPQDPGPGQPEPSRPPSDPAPDPGPSAPAPSNPAPTPPAPTAPAPPAPNVSKVQTAIAFAKAQLGKPYMLGGSGDPGWDCSGLTKYSYNAAGVYIGTHSATNQYNTMKAQGRLVELSQMKAGDLLWYTSSGGADFYHVTMYIGDGQMIEAAYPGTRVRIVPVRYGELWSKAGRPTG